MPQSSKFGLSAEVLLKRKAENYMDGRIFVPLVAALRISPLGQIQLRVIQITRIFMVGLRPNRIRKRLRSSSPLSPKNLFPTQTNREISSC